LSHTRLELLLVGPESSHIVRLLLLLQVYRPIPLLLLLLLHHLLLLLLLLLLLHHVTSHASHIGPHLTWVLLWLWLHLVLNIGRESHITSTSTPTPSSTTVLPLFDEGSHKAWIRLENLQHLLLLLG